MNGRFFSARNPWLDFLGPQTTRSSVSLEFLLGLVVRRDIAALFGFQLARLWCAVLSLFISQRNVRRASLCYSLASKLPWRNPMAQSLGAGC